MLCLQQVALFNESNSCIDNTSKSKVLNSTICHYPNLSYCGGLTKKQIGHSSDCFESRLPDDLGASFFSLMSLAMFTSLKSVTEGLKTLSPS